MKLRRAFLLAALAIAPPCAARAGGTLATPLVSNGAGGPNVVCRAVNVGKKPIVLDVELIRAEDGSVFASALDCTLDPLIAGCSAADFGGGPKLCRFIVKQGSPRSLRATISQESGGEPLTVLPAQ